LTILVASIVIVAGIIGGLALLLPPVISLSSNVVRQGDTMHLHGSGFIPGSRVGLTLDDRLPLFMLKHSIAGESMYTAGDAHFAIGQATSPARTIQVSMNGTFEVAIVVGQNWHFGHHTINAMESISLRSAEVSFTIVALPGKLSLTSAALDFGMLQKGSTATQILTISNTGQQPFDWNVNVGNATWLSLDTSTGTLQPGTFQTVHVTADASSLKVGNYSATLVVSEGSESMQVGVSLAVTAPIVPTPTPTPTTSPSLRQPTVPTRPSSPTRSPTPTSAPKPKLTPSPVPTQSLPPRHPSAGG